MTPEEQRKRTQERIRRRPDPAVEVIKAMMEQQAVAQAAADAAQRAAEENKPKMPVWIWAVVAFFGMMLFTRE